MTLDEAWDNFIRTVAEALGIKWLLDKITRKR